MSVPMTASGLRSPIAPVSAPRSAAASPNRPKFDANLLRAYMKKLLASTLAGAPWPAQTDKDKVRLWCREIGERVKQRALGESVSRLDVFVLMCAEMEPRGL